MATVLCVDDDHAGLATVARVLRQVAPVATARSAAEAETALDAEVAVVVSDYRMPGTTGAELLAAIRARDETIGRILLTAYADAEILMEAINRGHVHRYVAKPWDPRELRAAVRQALAAAEAERERRRLADEIARAYERLRETDALKTRFLTVAAHELRTPLHVLGGVLEALEDSAEVRAEAADLLAVAARNLAWLGRSVRAMTDLARLSQPERRPPQRLSVATIVTAAVAEVEAMCGTRRLRVTRAITVPAAVRGDAADLHHATMNLLLNAVRFTPDGGAIDVSVTDDGERVRIAVRDDGVGIPTGAARHGSASRSSPPRSPIITTAIGSRSAPAASGSASPWRARSPPTTAGGCASRARRDADRRSRSSSPARAPTATPPVRDAAARQRLDRVITRGGPRLQCGRGREYERGNGRRRETDLRLRGSDGASVPPLRSRRRRDDAHQDELRRRRLRAAYRSDRVRRRPPLGVRRDRVRLPALAARGDAGDLRRVLCRSATARRAPELGLPRRLTPSEGAVRMRRASGSRRERFPWVRRACAFSTCRRSTRR